MTPESFNFIPALPEIFLLGMICVVLLADLFVTQKQRWLTYSLAQLSLIGTAALVGYLYQLPKTIIFDGSFIWDPIASLFKLFILIVSLFAFIYARDYIKSRQIAEGEYYLLGLFSILGMLVLVSAYSLLTVFLGLELLSLPLYAMVALQRQNGLSSEAGMKYFVMGSIASGMLLYGMSMIYGGTHSLEINKIAQLISSISFNEKLLLIFGLVFLITGIAFKLGATPFHMWLPDVYQGSPTSVTLFVGSAPKIAALGMAVRLLADAMPTLILQWQQVFIVIAILSIALGNVVAIVQSNLKRMLAYSAIAHIGYMSLGLLAGTPTGYAMAMFYIFIYAIMSVGAFAMLILLSNAGVEAEYISDLKGLNARSPWLAFMMLLMMFSMAGIPPTVGFFAKLGVLQALMDVHMVWLATLALVFSIIGAYYYLNVVKVMYFEEPEIVTPVSSAIDVRVAVSINGLVLLYLGLFPSTLIELCHRAFNS